MCFPSACTIFTPRAFFGAFRVAHLLVRHLFHLDTAHSLY